MLTTLLFPDSKTVKFDELIVEENVLVFVMTAFQTEAECPVCSHLSQSVHSRYNRYCH